MKHPYKIVLAVAVSFLFPLAAGAQQLIGFGDHSPREKRMNSPLEGRFFVPQAHRNPQKTTLAFARLSSNYDGNGTAGGSYLNHDSSTYSYTSNQHLGFDLTGNVPQVLVNGAIVDGNDDTTTNWLWSSASNSYNPNFRIVNSFDAQDRPWMTIFQSPTGGAWNDNSRDRNWYNTAGLDSFDLGETWNAISMSWQNSSQYFYAYDGSQNLMIETSQYWDLSSSQWKNGSRDSFSYNAHKDLNYQLQQQWSDFHNNWINFSRAFYTYTASFMQATVASQQYDTLSSSWNNVYHSATYYNASDQIIAITTQNGSGSTWTNSDSIALTSFNGSGQALTELDFTWAAGSWKPNYRTTVTYSSGGLQVVALVETWNGTAFVNFYRSTTLYNSFNKPTDAFTEHWNGTAWVINNSDQSKRYHYDIISTGVATSAVPGVQADIYPVPAQEVLHLEAHFQHPQSCTGSIYDASGRLIMRWTDQTQANYTRQFPVDALPNGVYYMSLSGKDGSWGQLFSVAH